MEIKFLDLKGGCNFQLTSDDAAYIGGVYIFKIFFWIQDRILL